MTATASHNLAA